MKLSNVVMDRSSPLVGGGPVSLLLPAWEILCVTQTFNLYVAILFGLWSLSLKGFSATTLASSFSHSGSGTYCIPFSRRCERLISNLCPALVLPLHTTISRLLSSTAASRQRVFANQQC
jgi:hypothetical protein